MTTHALSPTAREAIAWAVRLQSQGVGLAPDPTVQAAFERWHDQHAEHAAAWARLQQRLALTTSIRTVEQRTALEARQARDVLLRPPRRLAVKALLGLGLTAGSALMLAPQAQPWFRQPFADLRTGSRERRRQTLADGSLLVLNAASAVDVDFNATRRRLTLHEGELQVQVAPDATRPLVVQTVHGQIQALGTRFTVRLTPDHARTLVGVQEHSVALTARAPGATQPLVLQTGQQAWIDAQGTHREAAPTVVADAWVQGRLAVLDAPLVDVIDRLRPYRAGWIRLDPSLAKLRVQGMFSLDDTERSLRALADTLPLRIEQPYPWVVQLRPH